MSSHGLEQYAFPATLSRPYLIVLLQPGMRILCVLLASRTSHHNTVLVQHQRDSRFGLGEILGIIGPRRE